MNPRLPSELARPPRRVLLFALLLGTALTLSGCGAEADPAPSSPPPVPVSVAPAEPATEPLPIPTSGRLATKAEIPLAFKIGGVIDRIQVDEGDRVRSGQTLARLQLSEIDARVTEAESAFDKAQRDLERTRTLQHDSVATLEDLQNARTAVDVAEARLQSARFNRRHAVITAPTGGRVLRRMAEAGQTVSGGQPILALGASASGFVLRAGLPDRDVVQVAVGDSASVVLQALPGRPVPARVTEVAGAVTPQTGTYEVELRLDLSEAGDLADRLRSGFTGTAELFPRVDADYVTLPAQAVVEGRDREAVIYRLDDGRDPAEARRETVVLVGFRGDRVAVRGLPPGTPVVTAGAAQLRDRTAVRVVP